MHLQALSSESDLSRMNVKHELQLLRQKNISRSYELDSELPSLEAPQKKYDQQCVNYNAYIISKEKLNEI